MGHNMPAAKLDLSQSIAFIGGIYSENGMAVDIDFKMHLYCFCR